MNRTARIAPYKLAIPTIELFKAMKHTCVDVDAAVEQIPNTNMKYRKAITIQNKHASNTLYIGTGIPYLIRGSASEYYTDSDHNKTKLKWYLSANGTNEWYLAVDSDPTGTTSGLTQITYLYYATKAADTTETLATSGTVGSLAAQHNWGWGDSGTENGFNSLYMRTGGQNPSNSPDMDYDMIHGYYFTLTADDTAVTGGYEIAAGSDISFTVDGTVRIFGIGSGANTATGVIEYA